MCHQLNPSFERVEMRSGGQSVKIDANFTNIKSMGSIGVQVDRVKLYATGPSFDITTNVFLPNLAKNRFAFKFILPHLYFKGDYDMDMNILLLKYRGQGQIIGNFTNYDAEVIRYAIEPWTQLFLPGQPVQGPTYFGKATLDVITDNSELFANEVRPAIENALADVFTDIANKITSRYYRPQVNPTTPRERRVQAHLELAELVEDPRTLTSNYDADVVMKGHLKKVNGQDYLEFERFRTRLRLGKSYFYLDNLFKEDPTLAKATHAVITENSELFANEVTPAIEGALNDVFTKIANKITLKFTYQELFPEK
ncbi:hypothetical protein NQ317_011156 [Molorchus minor]|uniref:Uncharacterized protein n=1 Tax=Molorchus minor TaxID=1323400 RepID=A0ABQ9JER1_9CUCU|nr:hypothetical protein NQ317_011156 [Molorchus minor]